MSTRFYVATRKGLFRFDRQGVGSWSQSCVGFLGDPVSMVLPTAHGTLYAALDLGHFGAKLQRSGDDGATWEECSMPSFPPKPEGEDPNTPWSVQLIWSLETGGADQPGRLWAGTIPGALFRSDDGGDSWELVRSLWDQPQRSEWTGGGYDQPGIHSILVDPRDSTRVAAGVSIGGFWMSEDDGATWELRAKGMRADYLPPDLAYDPNQQDPHRVVRCTAEPDVFWAQHHNGVFRSTDGAATWQDITSVSPSTFGFGVAVHPQDANTAWFVPAVKDECRVPVDGKLVVARTRDGGRSFDVLDSGLPQEPAYDLVYRHALEVDASGERLVMGSTSGGLWISETGGDDWTHHPVRLPPVLAIRFAA